MKAEIEGNDTTCGSRIGICLGCDQWGAMAICAGGWWEPSCGCLTPAKGAKDRPGGAVSLDCPRSLDHALLDDRAGWSLEQFEDFAPVVAFAEKHERFGDLVFELRPERKTILFRGGESWEISMEERHAALIQLCVFANMELKRKGSRWALVYDQHEGCFFRTRSDSPLSL